MNEQGRLLSEISLAASTNSVGIQFDNVIRISLHIIATGSPVGTFQIQCSNDLVSRESEVVNWIDYDGGDIAISGASQHMRNLRDISFKWLRLKYTRTSGTGSVDVNFYSVTDKR